MHANPGMADVISTSHILDSLSATKEFARETAGTLRRGDCIALCGSLGSGKTTFVRFLCECLQATVGASSPTYVLSHEYPLTDGSVIEHWDLYRLQQLPAELEEACPDGIRLIEWADRFPSLLEVSNVTIYFTVSDQGVHSASRIVKG